MGQGVEVWAHQFFGQYASEKTPDGDLPTLSGKSVLRGFPAGQFRVRYLNGAQAEYLYVIEPGILENSKSDRLLLIRFFSM